MERFKSIKIILFLAVVLFASAALGKAASLLLQEGLYAEEIDGDLDAAIKIYQQIIDEAAAQRSHVAQAMYRQGMCYLKKQNEAEAREVFAKLVANYSDQTRIIDKVKPMLDELSNGDPAALMPPETLIYIEIGSPGKQVETILKMLEGTPLENPLAAIGAGQGNSQSGPADILAGLLNPSMMAEFKKIRGIGVGIAGVEQGDPPAIVVLYPGKSDALRGIIAFALAAAGKPVEAIEGMQTVALNVGGGVAYDDSTIILANLKAYEAGQLTWCVKQHKGLISEPTLASSNKSFAKIGRKERQENMLTIWANVDEIFAGLEKALPGSDMPEQIRFVNNYVDLENVDDFIASLSIEEDRIAVETNIGFKDGHRSMAYDLIRTPSLDKAAFDAVPAEAIALVSVASPGADSAQAKMVNAKMQEMMGLEIGGDLFAKVDQITLFALPASDETVPGLPPFAMSLGAVVSSDNPEQTRQILTGLLTTVGLVASQSADEEPLNAGTGRYQIELVNGFKLHCYVDKASKAMVLSLNPAVIDASVSAIKNRRSVTTAGPLNESLSGMSPATSKLALFNVGGILGLFEADESVEPLVRQLATSCDKTTILFRTQEGLNNFNVRTEISGLPPVGQIMGPAMELSKLVSEIKARSRKQARMSKIPACIRHTTQPPVIDGQTDDIWTDARRHGIRNTAFSPASDRADLGANYKAMWDADNLYLLVSVTDDALRNDSDEFWLDDSVEVFIDADNSKSAEYGDNDFQYYFEWAETNPEMGEFKHGRIEGVEFAAKRTKAGYRTEIRIPWSTLGANPSVGAKIGLDVHVNDDDDGGDRDTKLMWRGVQDNASQSPRALGTAELAGLIGWWKFDGNANDSSGYANHGTEIGDPSYVAGKFGQAISFDGKSDRIEVPATFADNPELFPAAAISASAWVKATVSANASLIRHEFHFTPLQTHGGGAKAAAFLNQNGSRALRIMSSDWSKISDGKWHHYAVTYNYGIHEVWIDGTKEVSNNLGSFPLWTEDNQPWVFGGREHVEGKDDEYYPGELDEVRLYNYALSKDEIEALHNEGK